jgi:hypothetical protein
VSHDGQPRRRLERCAHAIDPERKSLTLIRSPRRQWQAANSSWVAQIFSFSFFSRLERTKHFRRRLASGSALPVAPWIIWSSSSIRVPERSQSSTIRALIPVTGL